MTDAEPPLPALPPLRTWPADRPPAPGEAIDARCAGCGGPWSVHRSMAGFRLRCGCGGWVEVAAPAAAPPAVLAGPELRSDLPAPRTARAGAASTRSEREAASLAKAPAAVRARWTDRSLLELVATLAAIVGPQIVVMLLAQGNEGALLLPFASLLSCGAVVAIVAASWSGRSPGRGLGLVAPRFSHCAEALAVAGAGWLVASGYARVLYRLLGPDGEPDPLADLLTELGPGWALLVIAATPALVEELAFRGMLQARLQALLGNREGLLLTAVAFTLAHLSPAVMPLHLGLGLWLGWLRQRSGSVLPGMLLHFTYNAMVLLVPPV